MKIKSDFLRFSATTKRLFLPRKLDFDHILNWIISQAPSAFVIWETLIQMESSSKDWLHSSFRRRSTRSNSVGVHLWSSTEALTKLDKKLINPISIWRCKFHQKSIKYWSNCCVTLIINKSKVDRSGGLTLIKFRDEILIKWIKSWSRMVPVFSRPRSRGVTLRCDFDQVVQIFPD